MPKGMSFGMYDVVVPIHIIVVIGTVPLPLAPTYFAFALHISHIHIGGHRDPGMRINCTNLELDRHIDL